MVQSLQKNRKPRSQAARAALTSAFGLNGVNAMPRKGDAVKPVGTFTTEIQVPIFPLASRCSICRIYRTHPERFGEMTEMLMMGHEQKEVIEFLGTHGIRVTDKALSRHYHNHFLGHYHDALEIERRLRAEQAAMDPDTPATIASALARSLAMRALQAVNKINMDALAASADAKLIKSLAELARTIAQIDALGADRKLKQKLVELRAVELALKQGRADVIARQWIISQLRDEPEKANKILAELDLAPQPMKALTAGGTPQPPKKKTTKASKPNGSNQSSRAQTSSRRSRRPKR